MKTIRCKSKSNDSFFDKWTIRSFSLLCYISYENSCSHFTEALLDLQQNPRDQHTSKTMIKERDGSVPKFLTSYLLPCRTLWRTNWKRSANVVSRRKILLVIIHAQIVRNISRIPVEWNDIGDGLKDLTFRCQ